MSEKKLMYEKGLLLIKKVKKGLIKWKNDDTNQLIELLEGSKKMSKQKNAICYYFQFF